MGQPLRPNARCSMQCCTCMVWGKACIGEGYLVCPLLQRTTAGSDWQGGGVRRVLATLLSWSNVRPVTGHAPCPAQLWPSAHNPAVCAGGQ